jgi:hypothetical protein
MYLNRKWVWALFNNLKILCCSLFKEEFNWVTCIIVYLLVHTSNQGFVHTFKFSAVHIICSLLWMFPSLCSLPIFSLPSFPARSSQWCLWLTRVPSSLSLCITFPPPPFPLFPALFPYWRLCSCPLSLLTIMFLPSFPIDDYVPALFPYWQLFSRPLSLFSIMFLPSFPIFDYVPDNLCPWCPYVTYTDCWKYNLCIKFSSEQARQLLSMHKIMFQIPTLFLMQKSPFKWRVLKPP